MPAAPPPDLYFDTPRLEILPHLPDRLERVLDLGCGTGATLAALKTHRPLVWMGGVELMEGPAAAAAGICDRLWRIDAEKELFEQAIAPASLDLILCLDVLEHLADPWAMVRRLSPLLRPGGRLIVSVPNIRNYRFIWRLLTRGDFTYRDFGLLDRTHLRFFVFGTAAELAAAGGLVTIRCESVQRWPASDWRGLLSRLTSGRADKLLAKQILVVAEAR